MMKKTVCFVLWTMSVIPAISAQSMKESEMTWGKLLDAMRESADHARIASVVSMKLAEPDGSKGLKEVSWDTVSAALEKNRDLSLFERIAGGKWSETEYGTIIQFAGNSDDDSVRLRYLILLDTLSIREKRPVPGLKEMISGVEKWLDTPDLGVSEGPLNYFGSEVSKTNDYEFGIDTASPMYPVACMYRARMLVWRVAEGGTEELNRVRLGKALSLFRLARVAFPENRIVRMYLGESYPPEKTYTGIDGAPQWAVYQREGIERLTDIIDWWIDHRMRVNGEYGGGWGDDCEMWRTWVPVLIGFDDPKISWAQSYFSRQLLDQPHVKGGYMSERMTDVEHSAEDIADTLTPMMHLDPDNSEWKDRALRLVSLMENVWTGVNNRGFLQFKSTYFNIDTVDTSRVKACDTVYHPRAVQPALLYWQRTGDAALGNLFTSWMNTWVDAAASSERGKPAGVLPTAIHWPEGYVGGVGGNWWDPQNHPSETSLYSFPSAMSMMCNTLLLTYYMSGDRKYIEPIRTMSRIRLDYLNNRPDTAVPGSVSWCAGRIGFIADTVAKYRHLTGSSEFDELLIREKRPYVLYRLTGDEPALAERLKRTAEALRINFPGYTSEVRYTDRVTRFPNLFDYNSPDLQVLYNSATGDYGDVGYFPINAVRWLTPPRDIAALVTENNRNQFTAKLFHFGRENRRMEAELYLLDPGAYIYTLQDEASMSIISEGQFSVQEQRTRISFELPPGLLCTLKVRSL